MLFQLIERIACAIQGHQWSSDIYGTQMCFGCGAFRRVPWVPVTKLDHAVKATMDAEVGHDSNECAARGGGCAYAPVRHSSATP